jgi:DNA repair exonuclease SbcCD ATPase subunit
MREQIRGYEERVKSYIDAIEKLNHRDASLRQKLAALKQEFDEKQKDITVLRSTINGHRIALEDKDKKLSEHEKQSIDLKLDNQKLRNRVDSLEKLLKEQKEDRSASEAGRRLLNEEKERYRSQLTTLEEDLRKSRADTARAKDELEALKRRQADQEMNRSSDSGKREYLNEIQKKNSEISQLLAEVRDRRAESEEIARRLQEVEAVRDALAKKTSALESELSDKRKTSTPSYSTHNLAEPFLSTHRCNMELRAFTSQAGQARPTSASRKMRARPRV